MTAIAKMRSSLHAALDKIGHRNAHACPSEKNNVDPYLHELFVSHEGWAHFDKRRKLAIKQALLTAGDDGTDGVQPGTEATVLEGECYSLLVKKNNASERVDKTKIGNALAKRGFDELDVIKFMKEITTPTKPATSVRAVPRG